MKTLIKLSTIAAIAAASFAVQVTDADAQRRVRSGGRAVVYSRPAVRYVPRRYYAAPLIVAAPIAAYAYSRRGYSCEQLEYRCDRGSDWACDVLERDPNC